MKPLTRIQMLEEEYKNRLKPIAVTVIEKDYGINTFWIYIRPFPLFLCPVPYVYILGWEVISIIKFGNNKYFKA